MLRRLVALHGPAPGLGGDVAVALQYDVQHVVAHLLKICFVRAVNEVAFLIVAPLGVGLQGGTGAYEVVHHAIARVGVVIEVTIEPFFLDADILVG